MQITYTLNGETIFDVTGGYVLKRLGRDLSVFSLLLIIILLNKENISDGQLNAFKSIANTISL